MVIRIYFGDQDAEVCQEMVEDWIARSIRALARRFGWRISPVVVVIGSLVWGIWEIAGHASVFAWLMEQSRNVSGLRSAVEAQAQQRLRVFLSRPGTIPVVIFSAGLVWLFLMLRP